MAYHLHHTINFFNPLNEQLHIELYKKDVVPDNVSELLGNSFIVDYPTGDGDKFDIINTCEAKLNLTLYDSNAQTFEDFIVTFPDEWKMVAYDDGQVIFVGFLTPGEGNAEFQDKPYDIALSAVDGLGLLKGLPLTKDNGDKFEGVNLIIDYIIAILNKTGLDLNLQLFSNIGEASMQDRTQNTQADTYNQTGLHARSFLKTANEFYDCYTVLERILSEYFSIYQHNGKWVILRIGELQTNAGPKIWFTEYNSSGAIVNADQYLYDPGAVGRDKLIHPVEVNQNISSNFAIKSSKYTFNYNIWPEIPTNNKFERGTLFNSYIDTDGNTVKEYTIDGWEKGIIDYFDLPHPAMVATTKNFWRQSTFNPFGVEIDRQIVSDTDNNDGNHAFWLRSEGVPVYKGDRVSIGLSKKFASDFSSSSSSVFTIAATVYIVSGSDAWRLNNSVNGLDSNKAIWRQSVNLGDSLRIVFAANQHTNEFGTLSVTSEPMPVDGTLYIAFDSDGPSSNTGDFQYVKDFNFEYLPFIAGGYLPISGDFAMTSQNANFKDTIDEDVYISDSPKKVIQGALYRKNLTDLTTPTWHRYSVNEQRHFKELGELVRYNNNYRRMWKIEGQFDGLKFTPANNATVIEPLSFHRHFVFPDSNLLNGRYFILVPPLTLNYSEGRADMNFVEVLQDSSQDGNSTGDTHIPIQYIFG